MKLKRINVAIQFYNGTFIPREAIQFSIDDVGILRGYGIFDFMRVIDGVPVFLDDHLDRFEKSAAVMGMELPYSRERITSTIRELITINGFPFGYIKLVMTGGDTPDGFSPGTPNLAILNDRLESPAEHKFEKGVSLMTYNYTRDFPEAKSTHYAMAVRLQAQWKPHGHEDVLYHSDGKVSELSRSNIFFFKGTQLITNEVGILEGITRKRLLKVAAGHYGVALRDFTLDELLAADEIFITSSNKMVMPVVKLDDQKVGNGQVGPECKKLLGLWRDYVNDYVASKNGADSRS